MRMPLFLVSFLFAGISSISAMYMGGPEEPHVESFEPVYMSWKDLRASIQSEPPKAIGKRGKIYIRGKHLFINEPNKGIHVFDNQDPAAPKAIAFVNIPGNVDLAVKDDVLYADSFVDLVAIDISALPKITELNRQVDVFPYDPYQAANGQVWYSSQLDHTKGVVVSWKQTRGVK
jgi:hypothetical protein